MEKFVLDTSAFTNLAASKSQIYRGIITLTGMIQKAQKKGIRVYCPPSVWTELVRMLENKRVSKRTIDKLDTYVIQKSPSRLELMLPSQFLHDYVGEVRDRFNKGLRAAEKAVEKSGHGKETHEEIIRELRDKYRVAIRKGLLDSKEDLDVLLLAKELKATVVAKDEGIKKWSHNWGIRFIDSRDFKKHLK
jgi:hypothetical protein